jgi:uncharacterized protein with HEPN domain
MPDRDLAFVLDILNAARLAQDFVAGVDKSSFEEDLMRQAAVIRQIEIMGEATKRLSLSFRAIYPEIPWSKIAGMRDILIHAYDRVDLDEVWTTIQVAVPRLISQLEPIVPPDESS